MRKISVSVTTDGSGDADVQTVVADGLLHAVHVDVGDLDNTVDLTITDAATGGALLTLTDVAASATYMPRGATHSSADGSAALYAGSGEAVNDRLPVSGQIRVVAAQGGAGNTGTVTFWVD